MSEDQTVLPEVQTILGRAAANRQRLNELIDVLDDEYWLRRGPDDAWDVRGHLQHLASIEPLIARTLRKAVGSGSAWLCGSPTIAGLQEAREQARMDMAGLSGKELLARIDQTRAETVATLTEITSAGLDAVVRFPPASEWVLPAAMPVRRYLQDWAAHDLDHEKSIRDAITVQPGATDLATSLQMKVRQSRR